MYHVSCMVVSNEENKSSISVLRDISSELIKSSNTWCQ